MIGACLLEQASGRACAAGEFFPFEVRVREVTARHYFPFSEVQGNTQQIRRRNLPPEKERRFSHL
jgi:hypothetical protein